MQQYEIKITGSGTKSQIAESLKAIARSVQAIDRIDSSVYPYVYEDSILCTEVSIKEEEDD